RALRRADAEVAPRRARGRVVRVLLRQRAEILPLPGARHEGARERLPLGDGLGARSGQHAEHDPSRLVLAALALLAQLALVHPLDVLLRDPDAALDPELEHLALEELAPQLLAVVLLAQPGALRVLHQVGHRQVLRAGDLAEGG